MAVIGGKKKDDEPRENRPAGTQKDQERREEWKKYDQQSEEFDQKYGVGKKPDDGEESR